MTPPIKQFRAPQKSLGDLNADVAAKVIAAAADLALIVDTEGVITDLCVDSQELSDELRIEEGWLGSAWSETVAKDSRSKISALLQETKTEATPRRRQINHPNRAGALVPVQYVAVRVREDGPVVSLGRDLRTVASLQQRLVDAQQAMEQDYARLRHMETRYRLLFQISSEAVFIVDATNQRVIEANPAACELFGEAPKRVIGRSFPFALDAESTKAVQALLDTARSLGRADEIRAHLHDGSADLFATAFFFRHETASLFLVRLARIAEGPPKGEAPSIQARLMAALELAPDAFVLTTMDGRIIAANASFLELAQLTSEEQARGEPLDRWLGRPGVEVNVLLANLRQRGTVRLFATSLQGEYGAMADVEVSAASVLEEADPCLGFAIRDVRLRRAGEAPAAGEAIRSGEQLADLVGRLSLKDIVRETTDVIERLCIESALNLTQDNRALAAEMLGLSRQSLYVKLRRLGLTDVDAESEGKTGKDSQ